MPSLLRAGVLYAALRTLFIIPLTGPMIAVMIELPLMLAVSWAACRYVLHRNTVEASPVPRLMTGGVALVILLMLEALLSLTLGGLTPSQHVALYTTAPVLLGLAGQVIFALFPLMQIRSPS